MTPVHGVVRWTAQSAWNRCRNSVRFVTAESRNTRGFPGLIGHRPTVAQANAPGVPPACPFVVNARLNHLEWWHLQLQCICRRVRVQADLTPVDTAQCITDDPPGGSIIRPFWVQRAAGWLTVPVMK